MCRMLEKRSLSYIDGPIVIPHDDQFLVDNVQRICVCDTGDIIKFKFPEIFFLGFRYEFDPKTEISAQYKSSKI